VPTPWFPTAEVAINHVLQSRYGAGGILSRNTDDGSFNTSPFNAETLAHIKEHPKAHMPDWVVDAAVDTINYIVREYGCAPSNISPVRAKFSLQVHHVDEAYYEKFHVGEDRPFLITDQIHNHEQDWHQ